jgi:hypothetical protein
VAVAEPAPVHVGPWTEDDLFHLPDDGQRHELVEGTLLVSPPPAVDHQVVAKRLVRLLDDAAPPGLLAVEAVGVRLSRTTLLVPDVVVLDSAATGKRRRTLEASEVKLVVEIVSPGSGTMDRLTKPGSTDSRRANWGPGAPDRGSAPSTGASALAVRERGAQKPDREMACMGAKAPSWHRWSRAKPALCARAGIPAFWRVELGMTPLSVLAYHLEEGCYVEEGSARPGETLGVSRPFPLRLDPAALLG